MNDYSDEQVEAALDAWWSRSFRWTDATWRDASADIREASKCDMRRALAAASVPGHRLVLPPAEPQPDAPTVIDALPDYWDERRRRQGKPDLSRCAAELRIALAGSERK